MEKDKSYKISLSVVVVIIIVCLIFLGAIVDYIEENTDIEIGGIVLNNNSNKTFKIISSQENSESEDIIRNYALSQGYDISIEYAGTLEIIERLNAKEEFDAVWLSNSIWGYMLDSSVSISNSKSTSINPVIFGIQKSKAEELGFVGKTVYTKDIVDAIANGKLKFTMSNPTITNSGASAYLGMLSTLAGNPEVLTADYLDDPELQEQLKTLFSGMERSSGSEDFLEEVFLKEDYEAVVSYESSIINLNKELINQGREPLYAIYPVDGVSISDSPFEYIDNRDENKKEIFLNIQSYLLSNEGQKLLQEDGKRTWYGGVTENVDKTIFNPEWGIDTTKYISPAKYPSSAVIKKALNLYQTALRKPVHVVFCLDYSGSMYGEGNEELINAMEYILTEKAANDFIQFSEEDIIDVIPFASSVEKIWETKDGTDTEALLEHIKEEEPYGSTALYDASIQALRVLKNEDTEKYNISVVLMTDGYGNVGSFNDLNREYLNINNSIPIYSITFGSADKSQLEEIAELTNAKVFDGKINLIKAFKEVRGYN